jgi:3-dehydroquinate dehydratase-2
MKILILSFKAGEGHNSAAKAILERVEHEGHEGEIVDVIQAAYGVFEGIVINPAAYTHTSVAILDALKAVDIPTVEVHLSDIHSRDEFRKFSYVSLIAKKTICGLGFEGYREALAYFGNP